MSESQYGHLSLLRVNQFHYICSTACPPSTQHNNRGQGEKQFNRTLTLLLYMLLKKKKSPVKQVDYRVNPKIHVTMFLHTENG